VRQTDQPVDLFRFGSTSVDSVSTPRQGDSCVAAVGGSHPASLSIDLVGKAVPGSMARPHPTAATTLGSNRWFPGPRVEHRPA